VRGGSDLRKAYRAIAALSVTVLVLAGVTVGLRATYGYFSDDMKVTGTFPVASQALKKGSDVKYLGVSIGKVKSIKLLIHDHHEVEITLAISKSAEVPSNVEAVIQPNTFFGDKYVGLEVAPDGRRTAPWLHSGSKLLSTSSGREVEQLIDTTDSLFKKVNTDDLMSLVGSLTDASKDEGDKVAQNIEVGVKAATSFNDTLDAQLQALDALARFQSAIAGLGPSLNAISNDLNVALPTFNAARADFERALELLRPFADNLASLISVNRPSLDRILISGDNIARVLLRNAQHIGETVFGLSRYLYKFGSGASADTMPDGSKFAYFKQILDFSDIATLLCGIIGPPQPGLAPLQTQLLGLLTAVSGGKLDCSKYNTPTTAAPAAQASLSGGSAQRLTDQVYGALGQPDQSQPTSLQGIVNQLLAGAQR